MIPPTLLAEAEAAAEETDANDWRMQGVEGYCEMDGAKFFVEGVRWLFTRLLEMSEGKLEIKVGEFLEHDFAGRKVSMLKVWCHGRRHQHALDQAALLKARDELDNKRGAMALEIHRLMKEIARLREPTLMITDGPFVRENITIDQRYQFEKQLKEERAKCERMERALRDAYELAKCLIAQPFSRQDQNAVCDILYCAFNGIDRKTRGRRNE